MSRSVDTGQYRLPEDYEKFGSVAYLPDSMQLTRLPDWRIVTFAVTYPLAQELFVRPDQFLQPDEVSAQSQWQPHRAQGIRQVVLPTFDGEHFVPPPVQGELRSDTDASGNRNKAFRDYTPKNDPSAPRVFYERASRRYDAVVGATLGADFADATQRSGSSDGQSACFHHIDLSSIDEFQGAATAFRVFDGHVSDPSATPEKRRVPKTELTDQAGTIRLVSIELSQFRDPGVVRTEAGASLRTHVINRYVTLTIAAENLSSPLLEAVSIGLNRPRNKTWIGPYDFEAPELEIAEQAPLNLFGRVVAEAFKPFSGRAPGAKMNIDPESKWQLNRSNVMCLGNDVVRSGAHRSSLIHPIRAVSAIPASSQPTPPAIAEFVEEQGLGASAWSNEQIWAWQLATGADNFVDGFPDITSPPERKELKNFLFWETAVEDSGFAFVRKSADTSHDLKYFNLTHTRFVDLVMLVMRTHACVAEIATALHAINLDQSAAVEEGAGGKLSLALKEQVTNFQRLAAEFVQIRDRLWVENIPNNATDTRLLHHLREATGVGTNYRDVDTEINLRQTIYSSIYEARRSELQEQRNVVQEINNQKLNDATLFLALAAIIVAVPGFLNIENPPMGSFQALGVTVVVGALLLGATLLWWNRRGPNGG